MKYIWLVIILLLINCTGNKKNSQATMKEDETQYNILPAGNGQQGSDKSESLADPLILDGRPYIDEGKAYRRNEAHLITYMQCNFSPDAVIRWHSFEGMEQLENLETLSINLEGKFDTVDFTPLVSLSNLKTLALKGTFVNMYNLKGLKQLVNLEKISIYWKEKILTEVDFTLLASLPKLESLRIGGYITRLPDLTKLTNLQAILIGDMATSAMLESLEGIGAPNVRKIEIRNQKNINSFAPLNNLFFLEDLEISIPKKKEYKIADMENLPSLKHFGVSMGKIDLQGIENMSALEVLVLDYCEPFNIEGIGKLSNLNFLSINIISPEPSLEFLRNMPNLLELHCESDKYRSVFPYDTKANQVLDMRPLATLKKLQNLHCRGFIIKSISALDILTFYEGIDVIDSRLFDEKEKSKHNLVFEAHKE
jgi:hypothetical protein